MIERIIDAAREAGRIIEKVRESGFDVESKGAQGPVTEADRAADSYLRETLPAIVPAGWLSEETADDGSRFEFDRVWIVDPLDGTKEFVKGIPEYAISVALADQEGPLLGVIHNPRADQTVWAERGHGAFLDGNPIRVAEDAPLLASRSEIKRGEFAPFEGDFAVEALGSIAWKLACVACGKGSVTVSRGPKWEWDVCAGEVIIREAGGRVGDAGGSPLAYNKAFPKVRGILAGAPGAFERVKTMIDRIGVSDRMDEMDDPRRG